MNRSEYKKACGNIVASEELIQNTLFKIKKQKREKMIKITTCIQVAVAACFCIVVGIGATAVPSLDGVAGGMAGTIFGKGSAYVLSGLLFILMTVLIIFLNKRRK